MLDVSETNPSGHWRVFYIKATPEQAASKTQMTHPITHLEQWRRQFRCFNDIPTKTKEAVSCLAMGRDGEKIAGIGQRVSEKTYWVDSTPEILEEYDEQKAAIGTTSEDSGGTSRD